MIQVGRHAPDFTLVNQHGEPVSLSRFRGERNVLLLFFPFAFSRVCTGELDTIRDRMPSFDKLDTLTLAISVDQRYALRAFADSRGYTFPLLADYWPHGAVAREYGVFVETTGAAKRGSFVIDKAGLVRWSVIHEIGQERDAGEYEKALAALAD